MSDDIDTAGLLAADNEDQAETDEEIGAVIVGAVMDEDDGADSEAGSDGANVAVGPGCDDEAGSNGANVT